jgi:hypothetical protein
MDGEDLSNLMYYYMQDMEKILLEYSEKDFEIGFNTFVETRKHK